jgi:hypothetical protein
LLLEYAKRVWDPSSSTWVEIAIVHMTPEHAQYWDAVIQPAIRTIGDQERREGKKHSRADHYWRWPRLRVLLPLAQSLIKRRCRALTVLLQRDLIWQEPWQGPPKREDDPKAIPAAMILLIESYPWLLPTTRTRHSTFTWFIAAAPKKVLQELGVVATPSLGSILIDTALITSITLGYQGRMWLHADRRGGQRLFDFYSKKCNLLNVSDGFPLPSGSLSDGRHFYATSKIAKKLLYGLKQSRTL